MATKTMNVSLTAELKEAIARRVRTGHYGNASDVVRAGLRALSREEMADSYREWRAIEASLPQKPITPDVEERIERSIRKERVAQRRRKTAPR